MATATTTNTAAPEDATADQPQTDLTKPAGGPLMVHKRVQFTRTAAILPSRLSVEDWEETTLMVGQLREVSRFWQGDLLNAGQLRYGEKYSQALDSFGLDAGSLRNICSVAAKFTPARRREELSWTHHRAVAALPDAQADALLQRAIDEGFSTAELTSIVREIKAGTGDADTIAPTAPETRSRTTATADPRRSQGTVPSGTYEGEIIPETRPYESTDWNCGSENCDAYYAEMAWHCPACNRHWKMELEQCPACNGATPIAGTEGAVTGDLIIGPSDQDGEATGVAVLGIVARLAALRQAVPVETAWADAMMPDDPSTFRPYSDVLGEIMAAHEYLGRMIEHFAEQGEPEASTAPEIVEAAPVATDDATTAVEATSDDDEASDEDDEAELLRLAAESGDDSDEDDEAELLRQAEIEQEEDDSANGDDVDATPVVVDQAAQVRELTAARQARSRTARAPRPSVNAVPKPGQATRPARSARGR